MKLKNETEQFVALPRQLAIGQISDQASVDR
jgi:hypothetical protein